MKHKVVFETCQRSWEIRDYSAMVRPGRCDRDTEAWEWDWTAAATLNIPPPVNLDTMDEEHMPKDEKHGDEVPQPDTEHKGKDMEHDDAADEQQDENKDPNSTPGPHLEAADHNLKGMAQDPIVSGLVDVPQHAREVR